MINLDCTMRDGGYYNNWDFPEGVVNDYLHAMSEAGVDIVELGMRSLQINGFKGASAYSTDDYLESLYIPNSLSVGVMINASELLGDEPLESCLTKLFPRPASISPVDVVRVACHVHEFEQALPAVSWLKASGYQVCFNLMQIAERTSQEIVDLARSAASFDLDALYFADSMGSMRPDDCRNIFVLIRTHWKGAVGIHTHDNMGLALQNSLAALDAGVTWVDSTVTGMGRGPGNARTEELVIEMSERRGKQVNLVPLMALIRQVFQPLKNDCGWGSNPYYFLSGKHSIHPSYVQAMLADSRYDEEDVLAVIDYLRRHGGGTFSAARLDSARNFFDGIPSGDWEPRSIFDKQEVLLLGTGPGVKAHRAAIERFIRTRQPKVVALNTLSDIEADLIDYRVACHPVRLLADCDVHSDLPQPLITPLSSLPDEVKAALKGKRIFNFGIGIEAGQFAFCPSHCTLPGAAVIGYALAMLTSGNCRRILLAGFDGFGADDPRTSEMKELLRLYGEHEEAVPLVSITPSAYGLEMSSVYAL
jgi:4-hydroxy 2-oxovalerate aldolase